MKKPIIIGDKTFKYKKDALAFYKNILNRYKFNESLFDEDYNDVIDLVIYSNNSLDSENEAIEEEVAISENDESEVEEVQIVDVRVARVQFNTKCFELIFSDSSSQYISYILRVNKPPYNPDADFNNACRSTIQNDLRAVKQKYFDANSIKGQVKCQETGHWCKWEDLVVDHRQPNTFSVIIDRFKELKQIDTKNIEYDTDENNRMVICDPDLRQAFMDYHKAKANLRIVKKENNLSRTGMARVKQTTKDLKID